MPEYTVYWSRKQEARAVISANDYGEAYDIANNLSDDEIDNCVAEWLTQDRYELGEIE